jgi:hypothetical protein
VQSAGDFEAAASVLVTSFNRPVRLVVAGMTWRKGMVGGKKKAEETEDD